MGGQRVRARGLYKFFEFARGMSARARGGVRV
jgi:hypothetical protein